MSILDTQTDEFLSLYHDDTSTSTSTGTGTYHSDLSLTTEAFAIIKCHSQHLRDADKHYRLDKLLIAMIQHAPDPKGRRYVCVILYIADRRGNDEVVNAAKAWRDNLFIPVFKSSAENSQPTDYHTPEFETTSQAALRRNVALREKHLCPITGSYDLTEGLKLAKCVQRGEALPDELPSARLQVMEAAHILPFSLRPNSYDSELEDQGHVFNDQDASAFLTWDMLHHWTNVDVRSLIQVEAGAGVEIHLNPRNAIFMSTTDRFLFGQFLFYFDDGPFPNAPNKYRATATSDWDFLSTGASCVDVAFPIKADSGVEPPSPALLKVHKALAKVLNDSGVADYLEGVFTDVDVEEQG